MLMSRPLQAGGARIETDMGDAYQQTMQRRPLQAGGARIETPSA